MTTLTIRLDDKILKQLTHKSHQFHRPKSYLVRLAISQFLNDEVDYLEAMTRLHDKNDETISFEKMRKQFEDRI